MWCTLTLTLNCVVCTLYTVLYRVQHEKLVRANRLSSTIDGNIQGLNYDFRDYLENFIRMNHFEK